MGIVFYYYKKKFMSEKVITKQSEYYLEFLKSNPIKGYEYKYFSEEQDDDGKSKIVLTLNVDCETYVFGENNREEILEEMEKLPYGVFGYDSQFISLKIVNKDKFFDNHIIPLKKYLKESLIGGEIKTINFYRRKGSEIYPPEVSISIKPDRTSTEWTDTSVKLKTLLNSYCNKNHFNNLEFITPMSSYENYLYGG